MTNSIPIKCNLPISTHDTRVDSVVSTILNNTTEIEELTDGYEFFFTADANWITRLAEFIYNEQQCCSSFLFELVVRPNQQPISLKLRGGDQVKTFIRQFQPILSGKNKS